MLRYRGASTLRSSIRAQVTRNSETRSSSARPLTAAVVGLVLAGVAAWILVAAEEHAQRVQDFLTAREEPFYLIGEITDGSGKVRYS